jgi:hypothetical protein
VRDIGYSGTATRVARVNLFVWRFEFDGIVRAFVETSTPVKEGKQYTATGARRTHEGGIAHLWDAEVQELPTW